MYQVTNANTAISSNHHGHSRLVTRAGRAASTTGSVMGAALLASAAGGTHRLGGFVDTAGEVGPVATGVETGDDGSGTGADPTGLEPTPTGAGAVRVGSTRTDGGGAGTAAPVGRTAGAGEIPVRSAGWTDIPR